MQNLVLSIKPLDKNCYDIHSAYYWGGFTEYPYILCSTHVLAFRENGIFVLGNWLDYYSKDWKSVNAGDITFHYQIYKKDKKKIKKAVEFLDFLRHEYDVDIDHLDIYISKGWTETQRLKGFGYDIGEASVADDKDLGGTTDIDNKIIYSNSTMDEFYMHDMMRFVRVCYSNAHHLLTDGLSEYYSETSEMRGVPFKELFKNLDSYLSDHPEINLKNFDSFDSGNLTEKNYLIGLVLVKLIEDNCGHEGLLEALETVHTDSELIAFLDSKLGIEEDEIDSLLRNKIKFYSSESFVGKRWRTTSL